MSRHKKSRVKANIRGPQEKAEQEAWDTLQNFCKGKATLTAARQAMPLIKSRVSNPLWSRYNVANKGIIRRAGNRLFFDLDTFFQGEITGRELRGTTEILDKLISAMNF